MLVTKKFTFDSAHKLNNYEGKCKNLHGHTYVLYVTVKGDIDSKSGMVIDFSRINEIVKKSVINVVDHTFINKILRQPTAENMSTWIWKQLEKKLKIYKIELWETSDSFVTYYGE